MTPRSASLRVAHQATCPNANQTKLDSLRGCKCKPGPSYYTFHRGVDGKPVKGARVRDRQVAERALRKLQVEIDEGRAGIVKPRDVSFTDWADEYLKIIERHGRKQSTVRAYLPTLNYARAVFGSMALRQIGPAELRRFDDAVRADVVDDDGNIVRKGGGDATRAKHLRHLGAIFTAAVDEGLIAVNPVPKHKKSLRLRAAGGVESFTDLELARLWAAFQTFDVDSVYMTIAKASVATGARQGELIGANLDDLDLIGKRLEIRRHYDPVAGVFTTPKDGEARTVYLIPPAAVLLEEWVATHGGRPGDAPLFPAPRGGRVNGVFLSKLVAKAMDQAKPPIPKIGENGRARKPFHAFRSSYDRLLKERGRNPEFVMEQLGHSDPRLTMQTYGRWNAAAMQAEADRVETAGFPI